MNVDKCEPEYKKAFEQAAGVKITEVKLSNGAG
jgi:hypothetical protein